MKNTPDLYNLLFYILLFLQGKNIEFVKNVDFWFSTYLYASKNSEHNLIAFGKCVAISLRAAVCICFSAYEKQIMTISRTNERKLIKLQILLVHDPSNNAATGHFHDCYYSYISRINAWNFIKFIFCQNLTQIIVDQFQGELLNSNSFFVLFILISAILVSQNLTDCHLILVANILFYKEESFVIASASKFSIHSKLISIKKIELKKFL